MRILKGLAFAAVLFASFPLSASGDDIVVTRTDDPADSSCLPGDCSLRAAIAIANKRPGPDRILLPASKQAYELSLPGEPDDGNEAGDLYVTEAVEIIGAGMETTLVRQTQPLRLLRIQSAGTVLLRDLTLADGDAGTGPGGGILYQGLAPDGHLLLEGVRIRDSRARVGSALSASINFHGTTTTSSHIWLRNSEFINNTAALYSPTSGRPPSPNAHGAVALTLIAEGDAVARIEDSLFSGNHASSYGGALSVGGYGYKEGPQLVVRRSRFVENSAHHTLQDRPPGHGGAIAGPATSTGFSGIDNDPEMNRGSDAVPVRVVVEDSEFLNNQAGKGGALSGVFSALNRVQALENQADVGGGLAGSVQEMSGSTFCNNSALVSGGAMLVERATTIRGSTFCDNVAEQSAGGAILVTAPLQLVRSTVDGNQAPTGSALGLLGPQASVILEASTVTGPDDAQGMSSSLLHTAADTAPVTIEVHSSLIAGTCELDQPEQLNGSHSIESPGNTCGLDVNEGNLIEVPHQALSLAPLAYFGDATPVRVPGPESVLIDHVPMAECILPDQLGQVPMDGGCDAGAVERSAVLLDPLFTDGFEGKP